MCNDARKNRHVQINNRQSPFFANARLEPQPCILSAPLLGAGAFLEEFVTGVKSIPDVHFKSPAHHRPSQAIPQPQSKTPFVFVCLAKEASRTHESNPEYGKRSRFQVSSLLWLDALWK